VTRAPAALESSAGAPVDGPVAHRHDAATLAPAGASCGKTGAVDAADSVKASAVAAGRADTAKATAADPIPSSASSVSIAVSASAAASVVAAVVGSDLRRRRRKARCGACRHAPACAAAPAPAVSAPRFPHGAQSRLPVPSESCRMRVQTLHRRCRGAGQRRGQIWEMGRGAVRKINPCPGGSRLFFGIELYLRVRSL
jgi:hypothetical protein